MSSPSKKVAKSDADVVALRMHVAWSSMVTPRSSLLRKSVRVDRSDVGPPSISNAGRTAQLKTAVKGHQRVLDARGRCTSRGIRRARMQNVVCCNHARMRSSAGKSTQSRRSQQCAAMKATVGGVRTSGFP